MGTFTQNLLLQEPTPGDPAVTNSWGTILNGNFALIDSAVAGILALDVAGNSDVILTSISGQADQARNADFVFSGVLTGNITIFWPISLAGMFSAKNATTGAFSLTLAVNNGSGAPDGAVVVVPQGSSMDLKSNGTDILERGTYTTFANTPVAQQATVRANIGAISQDGSENFALDTGTPNHLVAALSPAVTTLTSGLIVTVTVLHPNTGPTDFDLNAIGVKAVYKPATSGPVDLANADLATSNDLTMVYDAALNSGAGGWFVLGGIPSTGTVTSIATAGLATGGPITGSGTITVPAANAAVTLAGTDATEALTAAGFAGNKVLSGSGYYQLPGGLTIQWGELFVGNGASAVFTWPIAFANLPFSCSATPQAVGNGSWAVLGFSGTNINVGNLSGVDTTFYLIAVGF